MKVCPPVETNTGLLWGLFFAGLLIGITLSAVLSDRGLLRTRPDRDDER